MTAASTPGTFRPSISMLGWGLDERDNLPSYLERAEQFLRSVTDDFEVIVVDDGSRDGMWEVATEAQRTRPWLKLLKNDRNSGAAYSAKRAIRAATKDYVFWQTVDWAYDISGLASALPLLREFDILQGVRVNALTATAFSLRSDTSWKGLISHTNYRLVRLLFQLPLNDYQNVTVYPRALLQSFEFETDSSFMNPELLLKAWWSGASFREVAIPFIKRERGVAKGTRWTSIARSIHDIFYWWFVWIVLGRRTQKSTGRVVHVTR
jgi:glycosyltransferase involved in cell wall biosynthesis